MHNITIVHSRLLSPHKKTFYDTFESCLGFQTWTTLKTCTSLRCWKILQAFDIPKLWGIQRHEFARKYRRQKFANFSNRFLRKAKWKDSVIGEWARGQSFHQRGRRQYKPRNERESSHCSTEFSFVLSRSHPVAIVRCLNYVRWEA